jgi:hypothetical protein
MLDVWDIGMLGVTDIDMPEKHDQQNEEHGQQNEEHGQQNEEHDFGMLDVWDIGMLGVTDIDVPEEHDQQNEEHDQQNEDPMLPLLPREADILAACPRCIWCLSGGGGDAGQGWRGDLPLPGCMDVVFQDLASAFSWMACVFPDLSSVVAWLGKCCSWIRQLVFTE